MTSFARRILAGLGLTACWLAAPAWAGLDAYVKRDDGAFAWGNMNLQGTPEGNIHHLNLTSQVWKGITWRHRLDIYEPRAIQTVDTVLLFITGGNNGDEPGPGDDARGFALARACNARCAVLSQVPNQPLLEGKSEDALIAETFVRYLDTRDEDWPLLFPMVKSAVRAMDAVQQWSNRKGRPAVKKFVVAGASKRGWTTWLTGAVDRRVIAIAPMVIDTLNMKAQRAHALAVWGKYSEQINDYTSRGLTEKYDDPDGDRLWRMVDPYSYRDRLTLPKLLINGTNDRYWTLDALNVYWDDLKGPKHVVYLPNAGHDLSAHRDYAVNGVGALFRHAAAGRPLPEITWKLHSSSSNYLTFQVVSSIAPKQVQFWVARSDTRDFRDSTWSAHPMNANGAIWIGPTPRPDHGYIALFGDVEYEIEGLPFHLSTQIRQEAARPARQGDSKDSQ